MKLGVAAERPWRRQQPQRRQPRATAATALSHRRVVARFSPARRPPARCAITGCCAYDSHDTEGLNPQQQQRRPQTWPVSRQQQQQQQPGSAICASPQATAATEAPATDELSHDVAQALIHAAEPPREQQHERADEVMPNTHPGPSRCSSSSSRIVGVPPAAAAAAAGRSSEPPLLRAVHMAASQTAGLRDYMEDYSFVAALHPHLGVTQQHHGGGGAAVTLQQQGAAVVAAAGVFDGHAGKSTADFAALHTPELLHMALTGGSPALRGLPRVAADGVLSPEAALPASLVGFDRWWAGRHGRDRSGSTAVLGLVQGQRLFIANTGDSPALLARRDSALRLSRDHRTDDEEEARRVLGAGGTLAQDAHGVLRLYRPADPTRTNGCMFTRSLGDFAFKACADSSGHLVSCEPHVVSRALVPREDVLVLLASDGVTDALPDEDTVGLALRAVERAREQTDDGQALAQAAATEVMIAALEAGSTDNITAVAMLLDWDE